MLSWVLDVPSLLPVFVDYFTGVIGSPLIILLAGALCVIISRFCEVIVTRVRGPGVMIAG